MLSDTAESVVKRKTPGRPVGRVPERRLQLHLHVNRLSEQRPGDDTLVPIDPERHALEMRIEHAKGRLVEDLERASALVRQVATRAGRGLGTLAVLSGILVAGLAVAALVRWNRRQIRIRWR